MCESFLLSHQVQARVLRQTALCMIDSVRCKKKQDDDVQTNETTTTTITTEKGKLEGATCDHGGVCEKKNVNDLPTNTIPAGRLLHPVLRHATILKLVVPLPL